MIATLLAREGDTTAQGEYSATTLAGLMREYVQPKAMFGTSLVDSAGLRDLVKTITEAAGTKPATDGLAGLMREYVQPKAMFGTSLVDSAGLRDLVKTITEAAGTKPATDGLAGLMREYFSAAAAPGSLVDRAGLATLRKILGTAAAPSSPEVEFEADSSGSTVEARPELQAVRSGDSAPVYAVLVGLIMLSLLVACWLHEAERVGPDFAEVNRFDLLQSAEWAFERSLIAGLLILALLGRKDQN
jgi:hypothetical protein